MYLQVFFQMKDFLFKIKVNQYVVGVLFLCFFLAQRLLYLNYLHSFAEIISKTGLVRLTDGAFSIFVHV